MNNPNDYDDGVYIEATMNLRFGVAGLLRAMWDAGGSQKEIAEEVDEAVSEFFIELAAPRSDPGQLRPKPKR